jgi:hypothetical protein
MTVHMSEAQARAMLGKLYCQAKQPKKSKYNNVKTEVDGITFDSKKEVSRYQQLKLLMRAGQIADLVLQPKFLIAEAVVLDGKKQRARFYVADFQYQDTATGKTIVEDVKGFKTAVYRAKRHQMKLRYGIEVKEV